MTERAHAITENELAQYRDEGYCSRESVIAEDELAALRAAAERVVEKAESDARAPLDDYDIDGNRYVEAGRSTVQYEHRPGSSTIRVIEPFHFLDPAFDRLPNVMVMLDDANIDNGCFRLIPGSHSKGFLPGIEDDTRLGLLFTRPDAFDESRQKPFEAPAGTLVFFDSHVVHGSQPNRSDEKRRAMVFTYQPPGHAMFKADGVREIKASWAAL